MSDARPEISYLESIASAIINSEKITGAAFCLTREDGEPYVAFFGDVTYEGIGMAMGKELTRLNAIKAAVAPEDGHTTPLGKVVPLPCDTEGCVKEKGHVANHVNDSGVGWYSGDMPTGRP